MAKEAKIPEVANATNNTYFSVDHRLIRPIGLFDGYNRDEYPQIPELAENIFISGTIDGKPVAELIADVNENLDFESKKKIYRERFAGKFLRGGINTPLVGYTKTVEGTKLYYTLAGHRRTKACEMLFTEYGIIVLVPFVPKDVSKMSEVDVISFILNENNNRISLNVLEQAKRANRLKELGLSNKEITARMGKVGHSFYVTHLLKIHAASDRVKEYLSTGVVGMTDLYDLMKKFPDENELVAAIESAKSSTPAGKKTKIKRSALLTNPNAPTVDSKIELRRFFRNHGEAKFEDAILADKFLLLQKIEKNQLTADDLKKIFKLS